MLGIVSPPLNKDLLGEIDSLFVEEKYRKCGLGDMLMNLAIDWLNSNQAKTKVIAVAEGNEKVMDFYKKFGVYSKKNNHGTDQTIESFLNRKKGTYSMSSLSIFKLK